MIFWDFILELWFSFEVTSASGGLACSFLTVLFDMRY